MVKESIVPYIFLHCFPVPNCRPYMFNRAIIKINGVWCIISSQVQWTKFTGFNSLMARIQILLGNIINYIGFVQANFFDS